MEHKRAGLYVRVSTTEQANEGYSIAAQTSKLKAYTEAKDYVVAKVYTDPAYSGAKLERPGLQEMIADIKNGSLDIVVVYKLDRLSRSQKHTLYFIQDILKPNQVDFISLQESFDTSTSFGMAMIGILSVFAELERSTITERMMLGRTERAKEGYYHGGGNYDPLGYTYVDDELIVNEWEAEMVREIFDLYIQGNSLNATAEIMWEKYPDRIKSKTIVQGVLDKQLYVGKISFNGETFPGKHEAIIDEETFQKAQLIRKKRAVGSSSTNKQKGLLVGKMFCKKCGARIGREVTGVKKYRYVWYTCYSRRKSASRYMIKDSTCTNKRWKEKELDQVVIDSIQAMDIDEKVKRSKAKRPSLNYEKELKKIEEQMERIIKLYSIGSIELDAVDKSMEEIKKKKTSILNKKIAEETATLPKETIQMIRSFDWENGSLQEKIGIVDLLISRIDIDDEQVLIHWNF